MVKIDDVLAEMRQERQRLAVELARTDRVIAALEAARTGGADGEELVTIVVPRDDGWTTATATKASLPPGIGPYSLLDIYEATAWYLATVDTPKNSSEIAAALRAGGFISRSRNLVNTVRVMLRRKNARLTGISTTKDGKRWFIKRKTPRRPPKTPSQTT